MEDPSYWQQIEQYFVKKRGSALILSPKDWPLVHSWQERQIPLEVIYKGIDQAFARGEEKQTTQRRQTIRTLTYCQHDIEEAWKTWKEGHPELLQKDEKKTVRSDRRKLATKLRSTVSQLQQYAARPHYHWLQDALTSTSQTLETCIPLVEQAKETTELAAIRDRIRDVEHQLADHLEHAIDDDIRQQLYAKAEARLAAHKANMNEDVYQETLRFAFIQELREAYPLPSVL